MSQVRLQTVSGPTRKRTYEVAKFALLLLEIVDIGLGDPDEVRITRGERKSS